MKKILIIVSSLALVSALTVGGIFIFGGKKDSSTDSSSESVGETYKVSFQDAQKNDMMVAKGYSLQRPADPQKTNYIFIDWYTDPGFSTVAQFPMTVNGDTTLYARYYDFKSAFREARSKTIGETVPGYEYDYTLNANVSYSVVSVNGNTSGNAKCSTNGEVSFYDAHENSGLLFYDGTKYQIKRGNNLQKISLDENGVLKSFESEEVPASYKFDSSSFAKALFEYDDSQLKSVEKTTTPNMYKLTTSFNASQGLALVSKILNNATVKNLLGGVPDNSVQTGMFVTFEGEKIKSYRYVMEISVSVIQFTLTYDLTFKNVGMLQNISPRTFEGVSIDASSISNVKSEINSYITAFVNKETSCYNFNVKTGVDFPSKNEINSTFIGSARRKIIGGTVYFHNDIEIDSDYKNADLYKAAGIADVHIKRTRLSNGDVYNIEKKLLADKTTLISPYTANRTDSYYLFDLFSQFENYTFIQKILKSGKTIYSIGVSGSQISKALNYLNSQLCLDPLGNSTVNPAVFGSFTNVSANEIVLNVVVENGQLSSITMKASGEYRTSLPNSRDFSQTAKADFNFNYTLTATEDEFTPYETVNKAK